MGDPEAQDIRARAQGALEVLSGPIDTTALGKARDLLVPLRNAREYERLRQLAEALSRIDPSDVATRILYAQALIETGMATVAIDVLFRLTERLDTAAPAWAEASGLIGRANKQIYFEARDRTTAGARQALSDAIDAYRKPFERNPANTWHGVNLLALVANCRRLGLTIESAPDPRSLAAHLVQSLERSSDRSSEWYLPTTRRGLSRPRRVGQGRTRDP